MRSSSRAILSSNLKASNFKLGTKSSTPYALSSSPQSRIIRARVSSNVDQDSLDSSTSQSLTSSSNEGIGQPAAVGTLFGAIALITGSTVGAGMLALPEVTAPAGFVPTAVGLTATWALLTAEALLMAEVNLTLLERADPQDAGKIVTLRHMAERTLGKPGKIVTVLYLLLSYCLLVAYLAKSAEVLDYFAGNTLPPAVAASVLCTAISGLFLIGGPEATDRTNQFLTSALLALFVVILGVGITQNDVIGSLTSAPAHWSALSPAVPILFLALVYHDLVPVICNYLGGDRKLVRSALVLGSLVPLGMFLSWEAVALSLVPQGLVAGAMDAGSGVHHAVQEVALVAGDAVNTVSNAVADVASGNLGDRPGAPLTMDPLQVFVRRSGPTVGLAVQCFSFFAVITSFIGTVVGLSETMRAEVPSMIRDLGRRLGSEAMSTYDTDTSINTVSSEEEGDGGVISQTGLNVDPGRVVALALTLGPPLAFTAENPGAFLAVLSIAGGYGMTTLYGVLPPLMAWNLRAQEEAKKEGKQARSKKNGRGAKNSVENSVTPPAVKPLMPGGIPALASVLAAAVGVGLSRVAADADGALEVVARVGANAAAMVAPTVEVVADLAAMAPGTTL